MFAVIYRWTLKDGAEPEFREAWRAMTDAIQKRHATGGSRLHRADDGDLVAYAVWPSRERWLASREQPSAHPEAGERMGACIARSHPITMLDGLDDLLQPV